MEIQTQTSPQQIQTQKPKPTFQKPLKTRTRKNSHLGSSPFAGSKRHGFGRKKQRRHVEVGEDEVVAEEDVGDRIVALQRIVPGGEGLGADELFEETAGYILELQSQVVALRALTSLFEGLEKEKTKLGG